MIKSLVPNYYCYYYYFGNVLLGTQRKTVINSEFSNIWICDCNTMLKMLQNRGIFLLCNKTWLSKCDACNIFLFSEDSDCCVLSSCSFCTSSTKKKKKKRLFPTMSSNSLRYLCKCIILPTEQTASIMCLFISPGKVLFSFFSFINVSTRVDKQSPWENRKASYLICVVQCQEVWSHSK